MRNTKTQAHFVTNYTVLLVIILLLFTSTTVVARGGGGGHSVGGGGHGSKGGGYSSRGGGHGEEEEGRGHGIGTGSMVHRPGTRNGGSALNPIASGYASVLMIIFVFDSFKEISKI
ncbi:unnamed protein product [Arabis nemorensis]|uniref:Glycine-rich protein n=1 Tax=Arabis nemorensis TaxID=586526 RepID=A0A565BIQ8_9BRAS|nr:unnamed protein product [Arabis nemorensis]